MRFEVYCDEANPDVLTAARPRARYLMIGSLWMPAELRDEIRFRLLALRQRHAAWGEIKWSKLSPKKMWPLIPYAGSAAETSIRSLPMGSQLGAEVYLDRNAVPARRRLRSADIRGPGRRGATADARKRVATSSTFSELLRLTHQVVGGAGNRLGAALRVGQTEADQTARGWPQ